MRSCTALTREQMMLGVYNTASTLVVLEQWKSHSPAALVTIALLPRTSILRPNIMDVDLTLRTRLRRLSTWKTTLT